MAAVTRRGPGGSLASVHLPKTAGTSFLAALRRLHGTALLLDNRDRPLAHGRWARRTHALRMALACAGKDLPAACVHGHFLPIKYGLARGTRFCTWLRDPVQRVVSRYHHYVRNGEGEAHHARWGLVPGLSLEAFVRLPQYQDTYAEYFWMFRLDRFDFIGIVENYESDALRFCDRFGFPRDAMTDEIRNRNPSRQGDAYQVEPRIERLIRACNPRDLAIYERALELRARRN